MMYFKVKHDIKLEKCSVVLELIVWGGKVCLNSHYIAIWLFVKIILHGLSDVSGDYRSKVWEKKFFFGRNEYFDSAGTY